MDRHLDQALQARHPILSNVVRCLGVAATGAALVFLATRSRPRRWRPAGVRAAEKQLVAELRRAASLEPWADTFDFEGWIDDWIDRPLAALGGKRPRDYLGTADGRELVSQLLESYSSGAYW